MSYKIIFFVNFFFNLFYGINAIPVISHDNNVLLMKRQLTEEDISPNKEYFEEVGYFKMRLMYIVTLMLLQASVFCSLYVIRRTFSKNGGAGNNNDKGLNVVLCALLSFDLGYPIALVDNWPNPICTILSGIVFYTVIAYTVLIGSLSIIVWLKVEFYLGAYDYKLFAVTIIIPTIFTVLSRKAFGGDEFWCYSPDQFDLVPKVLLAVCFTGLAICSFCYCNIFMKANKVNKTISTTKSFDEMDSTGELSIQNFKKILGYLLIYNVKWIPLMVYIITDMINYERVYIFFTTMILFALFSGILNVTQYIINERSSKSVKTTTNSTDTDGRM
ncbi:10429_t:CDS:2 [Entrophospora sp. SA101]|nr:4003_t:CDS:2 [Entrophospora sp. SA101]CAJ0832650.1 10429_t:CDS:2 [Entrophospora sp. SA101]CAJ0850014.1 19387_t:CDS:2 [Entrophospora sp. SA101]